MLWKQKFFLKQQCFCLLYFLRHMLFKSNRTKLYSLCQAQRSEKIFRLTSDGHFSVFFFSFCTISKLSTCFSPFLNRLLLFKLKCQGSEVQCVESCINIEQRDGLFPEELANYCFSGVLNDSCFRFELSNCLVYSVLYFKLFLWVEKCILAEGS